MEHERVIREVNDAAERLGLHVCGLIDSPITGQDGNREFLACYEKPTEASEDFGADGAARR